MVITKLSTAVFGRQVDEIDWKVTRIETNLDSPARATNHDLEWTSDDGDVAQV